MSAVRARRDWAAAAWLPAACIALRLLLVASVGVGNWYLTGRLPTFAYPYDSASYLQPIDNWLATGHYTGDPGWLPASAGRMPGLGAPYFLLRLLLAPRAAQIALILLQVAGTCASIVWLGRLARELASARVAALVMVLAALNPVSVIYDLRLLTESLATTLLVLGTWRCVRWSRRQVLPAPAEALGLGLLLAWLVFLRPYLLVLLPAWPVLALGWARRGPAALALNWRRWALVLACLWLPFGLADAIWTARNWTIYQRLVPLQTNSWAGYRYPESYRKLRDFCALVGEEPVAWQPGSLMYWFATPGAPEHAWRPGLLAPSYNVDSLRWLRREYQTALDSTIAPAARAQAEARVLAAVRRYSRANRAAQPLQRLTNPFRMAYYLVLAHGTTMLLDKPYAELPALLKAGKLLAAGLYLAVTLAGLLSLAWWPAGRRRELLLLRLVPLWLGLLFCVLMPLPEPRYFAPAYPFLVLSAGLLLGAWFPRYLRLPSSSDIS